MDIVERFFSHVEIENNGCWIWTGDRNLDGYARLSVNRRKVGAHRWSYEQFVGPIPEGHGVLHSCDTPACVCPDHLWTGTEKQNAEDRERKGRGNHARGPTGRAFRGVDNPRSKLTEDDVRAIRSSSEKHRVLADRYDIAIGYVKLVKSRKHSWTWLD